MDRVARWLTGGLWVLIGAMFLAAALAWPGAPDELPVHWNLASQVDRYGGKVEGLLALPVVALLVSLVFAVLPRFDPYRARYVEFRTAYAALRLGIIAVLAGIYAVVLLSAYGVQVNVALVGASLIGALFVLIGVVIGQVRRNWFFGIRTPWTLSSETAWTETHRAARPVFVLMGVAIVVAGLFQTPWALYLAMAVALAGVLGLVAYSYLVWRTTVR